MKTSPYLPAVIAFSLIATPALAQRPQQQQASAATKTQDRRLAVTSVAIGWAPSRRGRNHRRR